MLPTGIETYLTIKQATVAMACTTPTVRKLIRDGIIPVVRFGRCVRIPSSALSPEAINQAATKLKEKAASE